MSLRACLPGAGHAEGLRALQGPGHARGARPAWGAARPLPLRSPGLVSPPPCHTCTAGTLPSLHHTRTATARSTPRASPASVTPLTFLVSRCAKKMCTSALWTSRLAAAAKHSPSCAGACVGGCGWGACARPDVHVWAGTGRAARRARACAGARAGGMASRVLRRGLRDCVEAQHGTAGPCSCRLCSSKQAQQGGPASTAQRSLAGGHQHPRPDPQPKWQCAAQLDCVAHRRSGRGSGRGC